MSKGNMLLGYARGSVGDLTFYRRNSQQVTRARARQVKNPKTLAQQMQRAIMRTAVSAYGVLKSICDHSFEGVAYGADSYAKFLKLNLDMLRSQAAAGGETTKSFLPAGFNGLVAMPFILSKGSISWIGLDEINTAEDGSYIYFNGGFPQAATISTITYKQVADLFGLQQGDQITLICATKRTDIDESSAVNIDVSRIILSPAQGEFAETNLFDAQGLVNDGNPLNENANYWVWVLGNDKKLSARRSADPDVETIGCAVIISRHASDGSWLRSNASLIFNTNQKEGGYTLRQASMVASTEIVTPSDWYLNNANEGSGE